jgi:hypothetical protein
MRDFTKLIDMYAPDTPLDSTLERLEGRVAAESEHVSPTDSDWARQVADRRHELTCMAIEASASSNAPGPDKNITKPQRIQRLAMALTAYGLAKRGPFAEYFESTKPPENS